MINYNPKLLAVFPVSNGYAPSLDEGPRSIPLTLDFSTDTDVLVDFGEAEVTGKMGQVQAIIIDNTLNAFSMVMTVKGTGQRIFVPAQTELCRPVMSNSRFQAVFTSTISAALVTAQVLNVPLAPYTYGPLTANVAASAVTGAYTDRSGTIAAAGVSQVMMAANALRKGIFIENPTTEIESLWINPNGAATQSQPSIELAPGGRFEPSSVTTQQITVIAATINHPYIAKELL